MKLIFVCFNAPHGLGTQSASSTAAEAAAGAGAGARTGGLAGPAGPGSSSSDPRTAFEVGLFVVLVLRGIETAKAGEGCVEALHH